MVVDRIFKVLEFLAAKKVWSSSRKHFWSLPPPVISKSLSTPFVIIVSDLNVCISLLIPGQQVCIIFVDNIFLLCNLIEVQ